MEITKIASRPFGHVSCTVRSNYSTHQGRFAGSIACGVNRYEVQTLVRRWPPSTRPVAKAANTRRMPRPDWVGWTKGEMI